MLVACHLSDKTGTLTEAVQDWREYWLLTVPLPHPSPRNNLWLKRNPRFERELIPVLRDRVSAVFQRSD